MNAIHVLGLAMRASELSMRWRLLSLPAFMLVDCSIHGSFASCAIDIPLLMLRILITDNVHVLSSFPSYALAAIAQLLHRTPHFHPSYLLSCD